VLAVRLGPIVRVLYKLNDWAKAPTKLASGGRAVRLDGDQLQPPNTVEVLGLKRNRIVLLVVPPHTDPDHAHATMMAAAGRSDDSTVGGLLMAGEPDRETHTQTAAAVESPTAVVDILHDFIGTAAPNADLTSPKSKLGPRWSRRRLHILCLASRSSEAPTAKARRHDPPGPRPVKRG
jgi:Family of unknown function (DUF5994)